MYLSLRSSYGPIICQFASLHYEVKLTCTYRDHKILVFFGILLIATASSSVTKLRLLCIQSQVMLLLHYFQLLYQSRLPDIFQRTNLPPNLKDNSAVPSFFQASIPKPCLALTTRSKIRERPSRSDVLTVLQLKVSV